MVISSSDNQIWQWAQTRQTPARSTASVQTSVGADSFSALLTTQLESDASTAAASDLPLRQAMTLRQAPLQLADRDDALYPVSIDDAPLEQPGGDSDVPGIDLSGLPLNPDLALETDGTIPEMEIADELVGITEAEAALSPNKIVSIGDEVFLQAIGNETADDLVSHVLTVRKMNGLPTTEVNRTTALAQTGLKALGYDIGAFGPYGNGVDGVHGDYTRAAVSRFQQDERLTVTGELDEQTLSAIVDKALPVMADIDAAWSDELASSTLDAEAYQGVANPYWYIELVVGKGDDPETMENIDAAFKGRLAALARDTGHGLRFGEGFRSYERQAYLYDQYVNNGGNLAAKPGTSQHNFGMAVDTQSAWLQQLEDGLSSDNQQLLNLYGLYKPLAAESGKSHESWHIQPLELLK